MEPVKIRIIPTIIFCISLPGSLLLPVIGGKTLWVRSRTLFVPNKNEGQARALHAWLPTVRKYWFQQCRSARSTWEQHHAPLCL